MGKRERINNSIDSFSNLLFRFQWEINSMLGKHEVLLTKRNEVYKDLYKGKVCFVLGNGPSLKLESRLDELATQHVFTVNQFYRSELFEIINPEFHVMMDPLFFKLNENDASENDTLQRIKKVINRTGTKMIVPVESYEYIKKSIGYENNPLYVNARYRVGDKYKGGYDMVKYIPNARNVVLTAIYCAIYMGFSRIVILGCDMTGLLDNYVRRSVESHEKFSHIYEYTEQEKERMKRVHNSYSNEYMLTGFASMFHDFRVVYETGMKMGIEILNATLETALDAVPYTTLNDELDRIICENILTH